MSKFIAIKINEKIVSFLELANILSNNIAAWNIYYLCNENMTTGTR